MAVKNTAVIAQGTVLVIPVKNTSKTVVALPPSLFAGSSRRLPLGFSLSLQRLLWMRRML